MTIAGAAPTKARVAREGAVLFAGYASAQALSFARNAVIGHALSKGDFGIAATITLLLQLVETLSDLGSDRLIVQAAEGDEPRFVAASHLLLVARGAVLTFVLLALGPLLAQFFDVAHASAAFQIAAFAPLIKGFVHLDWRRAQRHLNNTPQLLIEVVPQAVALAAAWPLLAFSNDYTAVVWLALIQAATAVAVSHVCAESRYRLAVDGAILKRQIAFGWPILASALPLIAVYQGDRLIIGHVMGMEALAGYTVAFMVTMVPGLIAAKVGHALMLPLFARALREGRTLGRTFLTLSEATILFASLYVAGFIIAGDAVLPVLFGAHYAGLGAVTTALAIMWALRIVQAVPGMALMAAGTTKPFLIAGVIRAHALPIILLLALSGAHLPAIAAAGVLFEALSLGYVTVILERQEHGLGRALAVRACALLPAALCALAIAQAAPLTLMALLAMTGFALLTLGLAGLAVMPMLRGHVREHFAKPITVSGT